MFVYVVMENNDFWPLQGGMSNELYNTIARVTDGIYEGKHMCILFGRMLCPSLF